ncbi:hypothetical protein DIPPA_21347 [Diplonema papillatum]|nr:hypothetical protein DIPPA_21347 [Diplonema papillatum]
MSLLRDKVLRPGDFVCVVPEAKRKARCAGGGDGPAEERVLLIDTSTRRRAARSLLLFMGVDADVANAAAADSDSDADDPQGPVPSDLDDKQPKPRPSSRTDTLRSPSPSSHARTTPSPAPTNRSSGLAAARPAARQQQGVAAFPPGDASAEAFGTVLEVDAERRLALVSIWRRRDTSYVGAEGRPKETFPTSIVAKMSGPEFWAKCRKPFLQEAAYYLKLKGEGSDDTVPLSLIAHNNKLVSQLIDQASLDRPAPRADRAGRGKSLGGHRARIQTLVDWIPSTRTPVDPFEGIRDQLRSLASGEGSPGRKRAASVTRTGGPLLDPAGAESNPESQVSLGANGLSPDESHPARFAKAISHARAGTHQALAESFAERKHGLTTSLSAGLPLHVRRLPGGPGTSQPPAALREKCKPPPPADDGVVTRVTLQPPFTVTIRGGGGGSTFSSSSAPSSPGAGRPLLEFTVKLAKITLATSSALLPFSRVLQAVSELLVGKRVSCRIVPVPGDVLSDPDYVPPAVPEADLQFCPEPGEGEPAGVDGKTVQEYLVGLGLAQVSSAAEIETSAAGRVAAAGRASRMRSPPTGASGRRPAAPPWLR